VAAEAIGGLRTLAAQGSPARRGRLASGLDLWAGRLREAGDLRQAAELFGEAAVLYRELALAEPHAFLPDLGRVLSNWSVVLADLLQAEESFQAAEESVSILRRLAMDAAWHLPALAAALTNLARPLDLLGRAEEAVAVAGEAVQIYRVLAQDRPASYLPQLAAALNNWSLRLIDVRRATEALPAIEETVSLRRELSDWNPAYLPTLAIALNTCNSVRRAAGYGEPALTAELESVEILSNLAHREPAAFSPRLASALLNLSLTFETLGRIPDASEANARALVALEASAPSGPEDLGELKALLVKRQHELASPR
jgi:tetratricopeptide (TPR) repeat protein